MICLQMYYLQFNTPGIVYQLLNEAATFSRNSSQSTQVPNTQIKFWACFCQNEDDFSHMNSGDCMGRRTIDFYGISMTVTRESSSTYMTPKWRLLKLWFLTCQVCPNPVERQTTKHMSSVLISSQKQRGLELLGGECILNYSFWYGSPFQNRNSRTRKGKKIATVMRSLEWFMWEKFRLRTFSLENWEGMWRTHVKPQMPWKKRTFNNFCHTENNGASNRQTADTFITTQKCKEIPFHAIHY